MSCAKFRLRNTCVVNPIYDGLSHCTLRIASTLVCMAICDAQLESIALLGDRMCLRRAPPAACAIMFNRDADKYPSLSPQLTTRRSHTKISLVSLFLPKKGEGVVKAVVSFCQIWG
jgi:hypothetical protein